MEKRITLDEMKKEITKLSGNYEWRDMNLEVLAKTKKQVDIRIAQMYEYVNVNLAVLEYFSELYGTKCIDVDDYMSGGCETCDYGSSYAKTLQIKNPTNNVIIEKQND